jgi:hypothetical protein
MTHFEEIYGQNPPSILSYMLGVSKVEEVDQMITVQEYILHTIKDNLAMSQNHLKKHADQGHSEHQFVEGD